MKPLPTLLALLALLGLAGPALASTAPPEQVSSLIKTYFYDFERDLDLDKQPDFWERARDRDHPNYVEARLDFTSAQAGNGSLKIQCGGASAEFLSPWIPIEGSAAYDVTGFIKSDSLPPTDLRQARAYIEARLYGVDGAPLASVRCFPEVTGTADWQPVSAVDVSRKFPGATKLRVAVVLDGLSLTGAAWFDSIEVTKRPVAFLRTNRAANCFYAADKKTVSFEAQGLPAGQYALTLIVRDANQNEQHKVSLTTEAASDGKLAVNYSLPLASPGPYVVEVHLASGQTLVLKQSCRMGVLPDRTIGETARNFGVSLSAVPASTSLEYEMTLVSGVGWVKVPLADVETVSKTQYLRVLNEFRRQGMIPVGVLTVKGPASGAQGQADTPARALLDRILKGPDGWMPVFGDTINTFAGSVQWWQVGREQDIDIADSAPAVDALGDIVKFMNSISYQSKLGIPAGTIDASSPLGGAVPAFLSLDSGRFAEMAPGAAASTGKQCWVWVDPSKWHGSSAGAASLAAEDIAGLFAGGAQIVFLRDPWESLGILDGEGNVMPFALALMNLIRELSNYAYTGSIALPNNTPNAVFTGSDNTRVLLWPAAQPREEHFFLGDFVGLIDMYGRKADVDQRDGENVLLVKDTPVILERVDSAVVDTRKTFMIEPDVIDSVYEVQPVYVSFTNRFNASIVGELSLKFPSGWEAQPNVFFVRLKPGESFRGRANLVVAYNALAGQHEITASLQIGDLGTQRIVFVDRKQLSSHAFKMEIETRTASAGMTIYQKVTNISGKPADVSAFLEGEDLERVERLPHRVEPNSSTTFSYMLADPAAWKGRKLRVSIREIKTNRFLNDEFVISPPAPPQR